MQLQVAVELAQATQSGASFNISTDTVAGRWGGAVACREKELRSAPRTFVTGQREIPRAVLLISRPQRTATTRARACIEDVLCIAPKLSEEAIMYEDAGC